MHEWVNPLTAMKKIIPTPGFFWSKSNFFNVRHIQNIPVARYQYRPGIYRRIYPAAGVRNILVAPDISGSWRLRG